MVDDNNYSHVLVGSQFNMNRQSPTHMHVAILSYLEPPYSGSQLKVQRCQSPV